MGDPGLKGHPLLGLFRSPDGSGEEDLGLAADLRWVGFKRGQVVEGGAYSDAIIGRGVRVLSFPLLNKHLLSADCVPCEMCTV